MNYCQYEIEISRDYTEYVISNLCQLLDLPFAAAHPWKEMDDMVEGVFFVKDEMDPRRFIYAYFKAGEGTDTIVVRCAVELRMEVEACLDFWDRNARYNQIRRYREDVRLTRMLEEKNLDKMAPCLGRQDVY